MARFDATAEDSMRLEEILALLDREDELAARADLAGELVRACSVLEDVERRALYPWLRDHGEQPILDQLRTSSDRLRKAMDPIYAATRHIVPLNVHTSDPEAFELALENLQLALKAHFEDEGILDAILGTTTEQDRRELEARIRDARNHAIEVPDSPTHGMRRWKALFVQRLDRIHDSGTEYHPGRKRLRLALARRQAIERDR